MSYAQALWVPTLYLLVVAGLLLPVGRSADRRGRVTHYALGLALFCVGSIASSTAADQWMLYLGRGCQGIGGALIVTTSAALAVVVSPPERRGRALGFNTMCVYLGAATGPPLGGLVVATLGWRAVFLLTAVTAGALLASLPVAGLQRLSRWNTRDGAAGKASLVNSLTLAATIAALLLVLTFGPVWGWGSGEAIAGVIVVGVGLAIMAARQWLSSRPLIDPELYQGNKLFLVACASALLVYTGVFAASLLCAVDLQLVQGVGAGATGVVLLAQPVAMATLAPLAGRWYDRIGSRALTATGAIVMAAGALLLATLAHSDSWLRAAVGLGVIGCGLGLFSTPNISAVLGAVSPARLSAASAILGTNRFVGQALSVSVLGSIAASGLAAAGGRSLTAQMAEAGAAGAFREGFGWAMTVGAGIALLAAVVSSQRGPARQQHDDAERRERRAATPCPDSRTSST